MHRRLQRKPIHPKWLSRYPLSLTHMHARIAHNVYNHFNFIWHLPSRLFLASVARMSCILDNFHYPLIRIFFAIPKRKTRLKSQVWPTLVPLDLYLEVLSNGITFVLHKSHFIGLVIFRLKSLDVWSLYSLEQREYQCYYLHLKIHENYSAKHLYV